MQVHDINTTIAKLTSLYDSLNKRWNSDPCVTDVYHAFRQAEYHETYENLKNVNIESLSLGIIANSLDEKVLVRLRNLLYDNILIYETRQGDFTSIDFHEVYSLQEEKLFAHKFALLVKDNEDIQDYPYPEEQERQMLLKENQKEKNLLENERSEYLRSNAWMLKNYYLLINDISKSFLLIINNYFPCEKEKEETSATESTPAENEVQSEPEPQSEIEPDMIFKTGKYEKLLTLETKLVNDGYLNKEFHWISIHKNGTPDIKRLIIFIVALIDNNYFLPNRDSKIKSFFESRYHVNIGQNFERKRRESLHEEYKSVLYDYPF